MSHTIEDALEILSGVTTRLVNIRLDQTDRTLIKSLGSQVYKSTALTDRQLSLAINKIEKYKEGLIANSVDVDSVIQLKQLRMPLREIDRTRSIQIVALDDKKHAIRVQYPFSKKLAQVWDELQQQLLGTVTDLKTHKLVTYTEKNLLLVVNTLSTHDFDVSADVNELVSKIGKISECGENYLPTVNLIDGEFKLENVSKQCQDYINSQFSEINEQNRLIFLNCLKSCGITYKNQEVITHISAISSNSFITDILLGNDTRFRVNPDKYDLNTVFTAIDTLGQWPVLIVLDDEKTAFQQVQLVYNILKNYITNEEMTVFFRLDNGQNNYQQFNQFVKDNTLNNYIDKKTKVVFITKTRIPKPLYKADWSPKTAIVFPNYDYGKMSAYLNDFASVYYYNNAIALRHNKIKGSRSIVEL